VSILTPEVLAIIAESVRTAPELSPEQRRALARIWGPAARRHAERQQRDADEAEPPRDT
jgi:hypothetical protein